MVNSPVLSKKDSKKNILIPRHQRTPSQSRSEFNFEQAHEEDAKGGLIFSTKYADNSKIKWDAPSKAIEPNWRMTDTKFHQFNFTSSNSKGKHSILNRESPKVRHVKHCSQNINNQSTNEIDTIMNDMRKIKDVHRRSAEKDNRSNEKTAKKLIKNRVHGQKMDAIDHKGAFKNNVPSTGNLFKEYHKHGPENLEDMPAFKTYNKTHFFPSNIFKQMSRKDFLRYDKSKLPENVNKDIFEKEKDSYAARVKFQQFIKLGHGDDAARLCNDNTFVPRTTPNTLLDIDKFSKEGSVESKKNSQLDSEFEGGIKQIDLFGQHGILRRTQSSFNLNATAVDYNIAQSKAYHQLRPKTILTNQKANQVFSWKGHKEGSPGVYTKTAASHNVDVSELCSVKERLAVPRTWAERHKFYTDNRMMKDGVIITRGGTDLLVDHINKPDKLRRTVNFADNKKEKQSKRMDILKHNVLMLKSQRVGYSMQEKPSIMSGQNETATEKKMKFNKDVMKIESPTSLLRPRPLGQSMKDWTHSNHPTTGFFDKDTRSPYFKSVKKEVDSPYTKFRTKYLESRSVNVSLKNSTDDQFGKVNFNATQEEKDADAKRNFWKTLLSGVKSKEGEKKDLITDLFGKSLISLITKVSPEYYQRFKKVRTQSVGQIRKKLGQDDLTEYDKIKNDYSKNISTVVENEEQANLPSKHKAPLLRNIEPKIPYPEQKKWSSKTHNPTKVFDNIPRMQFNPKSRYISDEKYQQANPIYIKRKHNDFFGKVFE